MKPSQLILTLIIAAACVAIYLHHESSTGRLQMELDALHARQDSINRVVAQRDQLIVRQIDSVYLIIGELSFKRHLNKVQTDSIIRQIDSIEQNRRAFLLQLLNQPE